MHKGTFMMLHEQQSFRNSVRQLYMSFKRSILLLLFITLMSPACVRRVPPPKGKVYIGYASWYGPGFHGRRTASGEIFNMYDYTAAHRSLPFGTRVRVTNLKNGKSVVVRINDRGPAKKDRIIDLSYQAAKKIDMIRDGIVKVRVEVIE